MKPLYSKQLNTILLLMFCLSTLSFGNTLQNLNEEDKKQSIEFRIREHLKNANLFEYSKWSSIEEAYYAEKSKSKRDKLVIDHFYSLYFKEIKKFARKKEITNAAEFTGILTGLIATAGVGPVIGLAGGNPILAGVVSSLGGTIALNGVIIWPALEAAQTSAGEHGPYSLIRNAVKSGQYARGKTLEDPYVYVEEIFVKAYFDLHAYQPFLFEKTKEILKNMRADSVQYIKNYETYVETAASLPMGISKYRSDSEFMCNAFKNYSAQVIESLDYLSSTFRFRSVNEHLQPNEEHPYYFEGIPGSGKTYAAKNLARGLGTTLVTVALDGANYDAIVGQAFDPHTAKERGRILEAFSKVKPVGDKPYSLNSILFIDEFDRLLNADDYPSRQVLSFMLKTLDPAKRSFYSPYLGVDIQLPSLIILAGNYTITDEALSNRFETVKFDGFDQESKMIILNESILPKALKSFGLNKNSLNHADRDYLEKVVAESMCDNGLRTIEKNVNKLLLKKTGTSSKKLKSSDK